MGLLGTNFSESLIEINMLSFLKMHLEMLSAKWQPFCLGLNVLKCNLPAIPILLKLAICWLMHYSPEKCYPKIHQSTLQWCRNEHHGISNHQHLYCLLSCLFKCKSKKTSKLHVIGLCVGNSPVTGEFPTQRASDTENVSIWWCHHEIGLK